jgi:hypothetical protein
LCLRSRVGNPDQPCRQRQRIVDGSRPFAPPNLKAVIAARCCVVAPALCQASYLHAFYPSIPSRNHFHA